MRQNFVDSSKELFRHYKTLGEATFIQLSDEELFTTSDLTNNSIPIIVNHLSGNMISRWTNFLSEDGEKEYRDREREFADIFTTRSSMLVAWEKGWTVLFDALEQIDDINFNELIYIRNLGHTIIEAVQRQLAHYAYHIGQIVFIGKSIKSSEWKSLSIPIGASNHYNKKRFNAPKSKSTFVKKINQEKDSK